MSDSSDDEPLASKKAKLSSRGVAKSKSVTAEKPVSVKKEQELQEVVTQELAQANKGDPESRRANKDAGRPSQRKTNSNIKSEHGDGKVTIKREKKIYEMPGQTRDTPDEIDPLRKFYVSLKAQRPESQMAKKWLCMYGLLSKEDAEAYIKEAGKVLKSPVKREKNSQKTAPKRQSKRSTSGTKRKTQAVKDEKASEDDSDTEVLPTSRRARVKKGNSDSPKPPKKAALKGKYAVFEDGGLDSDSDDDKPLGLRV